MEYNSTKNQEIKREFVNREVVQCVSLMISELSTHYADDDDYLSLMSRYPDPETVATEHIETMSIRDCVEYLDDYGYFGTGNGRDQLLEYLEHENEWQEFCENMSLGIEPDDVYEHWIVSDYLGRKLQEKGETVVEFLGLTIWGRCTSGQAILLDWVISSICEDMEILEGQKNEWAV